MARKKKIMLVKMTVEWATYAGYMGDKELQLHETDIRNVKNIVEAMLKLNAISVTIEKVEEGE